MAIRIRKRALNKAEKVVAERVAEQCMEQAGGDVQVAKALFNRHPDIMALDIGTVILMFQIAKLIFDILKKRWANR
jgi:hypothetical protein